MKEVYFEEGDRVWSPSFGWGIIKYTLCSSGYPISCEFDSGVSDYFTFDGRQYDNGLINLFHEEIQMPINKPKMVYKRGDICIHTAWDQGEQLVYFIGESNNLFEVSYYSNLTKSFSVNKKDIKSFKCNHNE